VSGFDSIHDVTSEQLLSFNAILILVFSISWDGVRISPLGMSTTL
jgi:hypothetical protein